MLGKTYWKLHLWLGDEVGFGWAMEGGIINSRERNIAGMYGQKKPVYRKEVATEVGQESWGLILGGLECQNLSAKSLGQSKILGCQVSWGCWPSLPKTMCPYMSTHEFIPFVLKHSASVGLIDCLMLSQSYSDLKKGNPGPREGGDLYMVTGKLVTSLDPESNLRMRSSHCSY